MEHCTNVQLCTDRIGGNISITEGIQLNPQQLAQLEGLFPLASTVPYSKDEAEPNPVNMLGATAMFCDRLKIGEGEHVWILGSSEKFEEIFTTSEGNARKKGSCMLSVEYALLGRSGEMTFLLARWTLMYGREIDRSLPLLTGEKFVEPFFAFLSPSQPERLAA